MQSRFSISDLEWTLKWTGFFVIALYFIQYILYQKGIYLTDKAVHASEFVTGENVRLRIYCSGIIYLLYFQNIRRLFLDWSVKNFITILLILLITLILNFRSSIVGLALGTVILLFYMKVGLKKICLILTLFCLTGFFLLDNDFVQDCIENMFERQEKQGDALVDNTRMTTFMYYMEEHFNNGVEYILGSGMPNGNFQYGRYMEILMQESIHYTDLGLLGLSWILGIVTLIGIFLYCLKAIRIDVVAPDVKVWFCFLFISSMFMSELYREGNFIIQALALAYLTKLRSTKLMQLKRYDYFKN